MNMRHPVLFSIVSPETQRVGPVILYISGNAPHCVIAGERSGERACQIGRGDETGKIVITRTRLTHADQIAVGGVAIQLGLGAALLRLRVRREGDPPGRVCCPVAVVHIIEARDIGRNRIAPARAVHAAGVAGKIGKSH